VRRRPRQETVEPYRMRRDAPALREVGHRLAAWMGTIVDQLVDAVPEMPIEDRAADNWEPLIAVADAAGGDWPARARSAAVAMLNASAEEDTKAGLNTKLLDDIRTIFTTDRREFLPSRQLVNLLHLVEESPWDDFNLNTNGLARRLSGYGIKPKPDAAGKVRGYHLASFTDAFSRYVPTTVSGPSEPVTPPRSPGSAPDGWGAADTLNRQKHAEPSVGDLRKAWPLTVSDRSDTPANDPRPAGIQASSSTPPTGSAGCASWPPSDQLERDTLTVHLPAVPQVVAQVRMLPGDFFLRAEVADALAVSPATLRRLACTETTTLGPSDMVSSGSLLVPVYDASAIARLHLHLAAHRSPRGRRRLWTDAERHERRAAYSALGYRRRRAAALRARGDHPAADQVQREADRLAAQLHAAHDHRSGLSTGWATVGPYSTSSSTSFADSPRPRTTNTASSTFSAA